MAKIKMRSTSLANSPEVNVPKFNFCEYEVGAVYSNNETQIDFITDGKSLYVCLVDNVRATKQNIAEQEGLLKLVSQGEQGPKGTKGDDGISGVTPVIGANFDGEGGKQLVITVNGSRKAVSPDLTGPSWKPVLEGNTLSWELTDDKYAPDSIDLMKLRPVNDRPILLRTNSDNTKRSDEISGPANFIQWKYEGDEYWTNLISISELMNLALAGVSFWEATDGKWHFGHREVVRANYISDKNGRQIISNVRLGDVLFDAGEVPFPDNTLDITLINQRLDEIEAGLVKSVSINGGTPNEPDLNGNVNLDLSDYAKKSEIPELGNYVEGIKINNGTVNRPTNGIVNLNITEGDTNSVKSVTLNGSKKNPNSSTGDVNLGNIVTAVKVNGSTKNPTNGVVDLGDISSESSDPDAVKSVEIDGEEKFPVNGKVSFTLGNKYNLFDLLYRNGHLVKVINGTETDLGEFGPSSSTEGLTEAEVKHLIGQILEGILDSAIPEYVRGTGHNYFVRINELNSVLTGYATREWVLQQIVSGGDPDDPIIVHSYRTFTIYKWYDIDSNPATPTLPTSASWDGSSNGLTLVGNTNNWTEHPGNRPNDSARLWLATITLLSDGTSSNDWDGPIDLTAYPGKDGNGVEFIFTLCEDKDEYDALSTPVAQHNDNRDDDYPAHWTDHPQGIGEYSASDDIETFHTFSGNEEVLFRIEAASIRTSRNGVWSAYCKPIIWSKWGEDGIDGDGLEYIFFLAGENDVTESSGVYSLKSTHNPNNNWAYEYQAPNSGWDDDPQTPSLNNPYVFVSKRKFHIDKETKQGGWADWSTPSLWSVYKEGPQGPQGQSGSDGDSYVVDMTNEMDIVSISDKNSRCRAQYDFNTLFSMYHNSTEVSGITVTVKNANGQYVNQTSFLTDNVSELGGGVSVAITTDATTSKPRANITVLQDTYFANNLNGLNIEFKVVTGQIERFVVYKIMPVPLKDTMNWKIIPSANSVSQSFDGGGNAVYSPTHLTCTVQVQSGDQIDYLTASDFGNNEGQYRMTYSLYNASGTIIGSAASYVIGTTQVDVRNINYAYVVFELEYKYDDNFIVVDRETVPIVRNGYDGISGKTVRVSVWESGKNYYDGLTSVDGIYYLDIVTQTAISTSGTANVDYYVCKAPHTSSSAFATDLNADKWQKLNSNVPVITPFILADKIQASHIDVEDLFVNGNIDVDVTITEGNNHYNDNITLSPGYLSISEGNQDVNDASAGVIIDPDARTLGEKTSAVVNLWQNTGGLALNVNGLIKHSSGYFANSVQKITAVNQTYDIESNLVVITCSTGASASSQYATLLIGEAINDNIVGTHITILRAGNALCKIQNAVDGNMVKNCNGSSASDTLSIDFTSSNKRADIVILDDGIYVWVS